LYAGTTDCVGVWNGKPAIIDFKQTNKPKKREWIGDYFLQLTAYAQAHNEMHGTDINTGVILMCAKPDSKDATPQYQEFVLEADEFDHWSEQWMKRVELYYQIA
jgi:genome maintenance exonuclease 1